MTCKDYSDQKIEAIKEKLDRLKREYRGYVNICVFKQIILTTETYTFSHKFTVTLAH